MDNFILEAWDKYNEDLLSKLKTLKIENVRSYINLIKLTIETIFPLQNYNDLSINFITEIDYGYCQGTYIYIIGEKTHQPDITEHWYTYVDYGTCSGCDTLEAIFFMVIDDEDDVNDVIARDLWTLCLHMMQKMKRLKE